MIKKGLAAVLAAAMVFGTGIQGVFNVLPYGAICVSAETNGDYEYNILEDGTIEISKYLGEDKEVIVPDKIGGRTVSRIGVKAFGYCEDITSVTLPDSITSIGEMAFLFCVRLKSINIPDGVTRLEHSTFGNCLSLKNITFPEKLDYVGSGAFSTTEWLWDRQQEDPMVVLKGILIRWDECEGDLVIPSGISVIGASAFSRSKDLTSVTIPEGVTRIDEGAFKDLKKLTGVTLPESLTSIDDEAFMYCEALESIDLPDNVTYIGKEAFSNCKSLKAVRIPDGVTSIKEETFLWCSSLESIEIPKSVTEFGAWCFAVTPWLEQKSAEDPIVIVNDIVIDGKACQGDIEIPQGVVGIGDKAFRLSYDLTGATIPEGVTRIGYEAFYGCYDLAYIDIPKSVTTIDAGAFGYCYELKNIKIPPTVKEIGFMAFGYEIYTDWFDNIEDILEYKLEDITLTCYIGTAGERYAKEYDLSYILVGDVNGDKTVNIEDVTKLASHVKGIQTMEDTSRADINDDGKVDVADITLLASYIKGTGTI